jgi:hypothetical protein
VELSEFRVVEGQRDKGTVHGSLRTHPARLAGN